MEHFPSYNAIDIAVLVLLIIGLIQGIKRGLSGEIARLTGTLVAVWAGWHFYHPLGERFLQNTRLEGNEAYAAAFLITLIGTFLIMLILRLLFQKMAEITFKGGGVERIGGALAGMLRMLLSCSAVIFFLCLLPSAYLQTTLAENSLFGRTVTRYVPGLYDKARSLMPGIPALPESSEDQDYSLGQATPYDAVREIPAGADTEDFQTDESTQ